MPAGDTRGRRTWWALETGFLDAPLSSLPSPAARLAANVQATGARGGHDLHYRTLRKMGVTMLGHFLGAEGRHARFAPDLGESVAWGDERNRQLIDLVRKLVAERSVLQSERPLKNQPPSVLLIDDDPRASTALLSPRLGAVATRDDGEHVRDRGGYLGRGLGVRPTDEKDGRRERTPRTGCLGERR
jgi:hypothetical protein